MTLPDEERKILIKYRTEQATESVEEKRLINVLTAIMG
jgi:hypothetical protein